MAKQPVEKIFRMLITNKKRIITSLVLLATVLLTGTLSFAQERLNASSSEQKIISGGYMQTSFTISRNGQLTADTHSWTNNKFQGFHGTVRIMVCNSDGDCYITSKTGCGVAGKWDSTGSSNRHCYWQVNIPGDIAANVNRYIISHGNNEVPIWDNPDVKRFFDQAGRLIRENRDAAGQVLGPALKALQ